MNLICLCLPSRSWSSLPDPGGMEGWVGPGATLVSKLSARNRYVMEITVVSWATGTQRLRASKPGAATLITKQPSGKSADTWCVAPVRENLIGSPYKRWGKHAFSRYLTVLLHTHPRVYRRTEWTVPLPSQLEATTTPKREPHWLLGLAAVYLVTHTFLYKLSCQCMYSHMHMHPWYSS